MMYFFKIEREYRMFTDNKVSLISVPVLLIVLLFVSNIIYGSGLCPSQNTISPITQNNLGNSSYQDEKLGQFFKKILSPTLLKDPLFIAGAGYGSEAYELLKIGAQEIYLNDLSVGNLVCASENLNTKFPGSNVKYVYGDITSNELYHSGMKNNLGLISAKHVINQFDSKQIDTFLNDSYDNLKPGGLLLIIYGNHFENEQQTMIADIRHLINEGKTLDESVKEGFIRNTIGPEKMHCSYNDFIKTDSSIRSSGYPCIIRADTVTHNLLIPEEMEKILSRKGFHVLINTHFANQALKLLLAKK